MEHQLFFAEQVCPAGRKKGRGDMPLLVGCLNQRNAFGRAERCGRTDARQKAWHIGAIHRAGPGGYADSFDLRQVHLLAQFCQHFRQGGGMVEQRIALAQAQLTLPHGQEAFAIANNLSGVCVKHGQRGCVIACIDAQRSHSSAGLSCARATVPSRPLTN